MGQDIQLISLLNSVYMIQRKGTQVTCTCTTISLFAFRITAKEALRHPYFKELRYIVYSIMYTYVYWWFTGSRDAERRAKQRVSELPSALISPKVGRPQQQVNTCILYTYCAHCIMLLLFNGIQKAHYHHRQGKVKPKNEIVWPNL